MSIEEKEDRFFFYLTNICQSTFIVHIHTNNIPLLFLSFHIVNFTTPRSTKQKRRKEEKKCLFIRSLHVEKVENMIDSTHCVSMCNMKRILILVFLLIHTTQISSSIVKDPFEYFQKLTRDIQVYQQCHQIPPYKLQLDSSFFDIDLRQWQRKKNPPPIHRTLEAFIQLDTLRQSIYFSHVLQGNSQAKVPGIS